MNVVAIQPDSPRLAISQLGEAERLLLWCVRSWVQGFTQRVEVKHEIEAALSTHRIAAASVDIDGLMMTIATAADRSVEVRIRRAIELGRDEMILLRAFHAALRGEIDLIRALLGLVLRGTALRVAQGHVERLATAFASTGLAPAHWPAAFRPRREPARAGNVVPFIVARNGGRPDAA